jgi:anti-sigma-K factor RskA
VSGCQTHGELIGGYVLRALEPEEMEAMRGHLETCPACAHEVRALGDLPTLLDRIEPTDVPPPALSPDVEEAVLDRFARERSQPATPRRRRRLLRWAAPAAAACAAAIALLVVLLTSDEDTEPSAYATAQLSATTGRSAPHATAYADAVPAGTRVRLWAEGLPAGSGTVYELWCVRADGRWVSGGTFRAGRDGDARAQLTAAVKPGDYHMMVVTRRADMAPADSRGTPVLRGELRY